MKITVTKEQLKQIIKEEANRYKRVLELQKRKEEIKQELNELYEMDMAEPGAGPGLEDEGFFGNVGKKIGNVILGTDEEWRKKLEAYFAQTPGRIIPQTPEEWAEAVKVARENGDVRIIKNRNGRWVPTMKITSGVGNAFDGSGTAE